MKVIGSYPICNTAAILVHDIKYGIDDEVLVSLNRKAPEWCKIEYTDDEEPCFWYGGIPVFLSNVMRV